MNKLRIILQFRFIFWIVLILTLFYSFISINNSNSIYSIDINQVEGILYSKSIDGDKFSFILDGKEKVKCVYYLKSEKEKEYFETLDLGTKIKIKGTFNIPSNNTIFNTFSYKKYLRSLNIFYNVSVDNIYVINSDVSLRYKVKNFIINRVKNYKSSSYLLMFLLGDKSLLDEDTFNKYSELGVSHVFAISGLHISLLAGIMLFLLKKLKDNYKYSIVIIFLISYMFITNFQPSIVRSVVFFILLYINKKLYLDIDTRDCLLLTIGIILLLFPNFILNVGFLYSSVISFSLVTFGYLINGNFFTKSIKISLISFLVSLPIMVNSLYEVNILSFLNNLFFVPFISFVIYPLSLISFIIPFFDSLLYLLLQLMNLIGNYLLVFKIIIPKMNIWIIIIYYLILFLLFKSYQKKYFLLLILLMIFHKYSYYLDNSFYVYYLDVGQGDAILIKNKNESVLIDTGGVMTYEKDEWKKRKKEYLKSDTYITFFKSIGIDSIAYMVLSHGDNDHIGEAKDVVNNFKVNNIIFNCGPFNNLEKELIDLIKDRDISYYSCINELKFGGTKLYFLQTREYDNENDNSNVIYAKFYKYKFIFMGDAGVEKEKDILDKYNLGNIDVLKVGHHGSRTSSSEDFINKINPKYSVISVGANNRYGHPNKEVLDNLSRSIIYRTDKDGSIMFKINNKLEIEKCVS